MSLREGLWGAVVLLILSSLVAAAAVLAFGRSDHRAEGSPLTAKPATASTAPSAIVASGPLAPLVPRATAPVARNAAREQLHRRSPRAQTETRSPGSLPPASAGTNGSLKPPRAGTGPSNQAIERSLQELAAEPSDAAGRATLLAGIALAPPGAPLAVQGTISAANSISHTPYIWGGGHGSWFAAGYDCSGAVSFALHGGGLLDRPLTSSQLETYGAPGPGRWITIYANATHAYALIAGLRWDTVGDARGTGPRWHLSGLYPQGFVVRHPIGY